jgi:DNA polymerase III epsilon subunit-like protein
MKYLIFDTETSGFPRKDMEAQHPLQARVLQLAALQLDENFNELGQLYTLIKLPPGKKIDDGAFKAHGKTWDMCNEQGRPSSDVLTELNELFKTSDALVAHNFAFDDTMIDIEFECADIIPYSCEYSYCTMELMTPICKLPHVRKNSFGQKYKWPKLSEAYNFIYGKEFEGAHDALGDVRATAKVLQYLFEQKIIKLPLGMNPA